MVTVLVEGESDAAALRVLARRTATPLPLLVAVGGSKGARRAVAQRGEESALAGLVDRAERADFDQVLDVVFVCDPDLEAEFIRALGPDAVLDVIDSCGELESFRRLQAQPAQRDRSVEQQLTRFFGGRSGNKARYAGLLAEAVPLDRIPPPLAALLRWIDLAG